jgi:hypothetical protein
MALAYSAYHPITYLMGLKKSTKTPSQNFRCPNRDSNRVFHEKRLRKVALILLELFMTVFGEGCKL